MLEMLLRWEEDEEKAGSLIPGDFSSLLRKVQGLLGCSDVQRITSLTHLKGQRHEAEDLAWQSRPRSPCHSSNARPSSGELCSGGTSGLSPRGAPRPGKATTELSRNAQTSPRGPCSGAPSLGAAASLPQLLCGPLVWGSGPWSQPIRSAAPLKSARPNWLVHCDLVLIQPVTRRFPLWGQLPARQESLCSFRLRPCVKA